ncbi:unnamed protein product [Pseudo-nitzschia multistriata]|uniref:Uncharacterized protein n=1 Tax=Pseudo-nitzschia multistriata TaxID=183589 RepID=A0A448Z036_9STRA|nr:unnamed protein product [Pseudo-nitzschia multistriata]
MRNHDTHRGGLHPVARALLVLALAFPIVAKHVLVDAGRIVEPVGPGYTINSSSSSSSSNNNINSTHTNATGTFPGPCPSENDCGTSGREDYRRLSALHTLGEDSPRDLFVPRISELLQSSVRGLLRKHPSSKVLPRPRDAAFGSDEADPIAEAVFASMNTGGRLFHSTGHVFSVLENCGGPSADPMLVLMVLFHDVIYYSVDANFLEFQLDLLEGVLALVEDEDGDDRRPSEPLALSETATREDPLVAAVAAVFGVEEGAVLPGKATNEFLSAVVATRLLSGWLPLSDLVRLAAGIEATIPFRPVGPSGETALGALHDRLSPLVLLPGNGAAAAAATTTTTTSTRPTTTEANHEEWRTETLRLAAAMGNCDLASLSTPDRDYFLDSTWSIIPEMNRGMLAPGGPSLGAYRDEFLAMEHRTAFLEGAVPHMFHSYGGVPEEASVEAMRARTRSNLGLEFGYTQVRRLQLLVLTDFVEVLGEDPWALPGLPFLSIREDRDNDRHSEDDDNDDDDDYDDEVLRYLSRGRKTAFPWDPAASPLGALLYRTLGREGVDASVELAKNHRGEPGDLLRACVQGAVLEVLAGAAEDLLGKPRAEIERALGHHGLVRNGGAAAAS